MSVLIKTGCLIIEAFKRSEGYLEPTFVEAFKTPNLIQFLWKLNVYYTVVFLNARLTITVSITITAEVDATC